MASRWEKFNLKAQKRLVQCRKGRRLTPETAARSVSGTCGCRWCRNRLELFACCRDDWGFPRSKWRRRRRNKRLIGAHGFVRRRAAAQLSQAAQKLFEQAFRRPTPFKDGVTSRR